jgi:hypothetical protein
MKQHDIYRVWEPLNKKTNIDAPQHKLWALPPELQSLRNDRVVMNLDALVIMRGIMTNFEAGKPIEQKPQLDITGKQIHVGQLYGYSEIEAKEKAMYASLAEFYKGTGGSEEEDKALAVLDADTVRAYVSSRLAAQRKAYERRHTEG